jgi:hypothetical protein
VIFEWRCESCGCTGTAMRLPNDKKSALERVRLSHWYARRKRRKFCDGARLFWTIQPSRKGEFA